MSKVQNNSSFYQGRYIQLYDQKTRNRQKASTSSTQHLFHFESSNNSPQKATQKVNFQTDDLSIEQQLNKMANNHLKIMSMMENGGGTASYDGMKEISAKKYDNFNPERYIDTQLFSGRKQKSIHQIQQGYQNKYGGIGMSKENLNRENIGSNGVNGFDKMVQNKYSFESKPFQFEKNPVQNIKQVVKLIEPRFESSLSSARRDNSIEVKTKTQYYSFNETPSKSKPKLSQFPQKLKTPEIYSSMDYFSRPSSQYIRMPQTFNQQFPQFFHTQPIVVQKPRDIFRHEEIVGVKPTSPELIIPRPSIPRAPKTTTLGSHKKIVHTYQKPMVQSRQNSRQRSNSKEKKLNLSINTINDEKVSNNSFSSTNINPKVHSSSGSVERKRRPSTGLMLTLMRK